MTADDQAIERLERAFPVAGYVMVREDDLRVVISGLILWRSIVRQFVDVITPYTEPKGLNSNPGGLSVLLEDSELNIDLSPELTAWLNEEPPCHACGGSGLIDEASGFPRQCIQCGGDGLERSIRARQSG